MKLILSVVIILFMSMILCSQEYKFDSRIQILKEDDQNQYKSDQITNLDLIQALEMAGVSINKFSLGSFNDKYSFLVILEEFKDGLIIETDTIVFTSNEYVYYEYGEEDYYTSYIDQIKIFSKVEGTKLSFKFVTYGMSSTKRIDFEKYNKDSFYSIRSFVDTRWEKNRKIPLLVYASSWEDKEWGFQRFCGVDNLSVDDDNTKELLSSSPHYFMISYEVQEDK